MIRKTKTNYSPASQVRHVALELLSSLEGFSPVIYSGSRGEATLGYGFALVVKIERVNGRFVI
jgi:hypothetical protein